MVPYKYEGDSIFLPDISHSKVLGYSCALMTEQSSIEPKKEKRKCFILIIDVFE